MSPISRSFVTVSLLGGALWCAALPALAQVAPAVSPAAMTGAMADGTTTAWTTFKGNVERSGASDARVSLPLSLKWRYSSTAPARTYVTAPLILGAPGRQRIVFAVGSNVYALDANTGSQIWATPDLTSTIVTPLTLLSTDNGDLILGMQSSGRLLALKSADGGRVWETDAGGLSTAAGPIIVETEKGTRIVVALDTGQMVAFDTAGTVDKTWKVQLGRPGNSAASSMALSPDGARLMLLGADSQLYIVDVKAAKVIYALQQTSRNAVTPTVAGDLVYTANARAITATRIGNGQTAWSFAPTGEVVGSPAVMKSDDGTTLFAGTRDGQFVALDAATGDVKWQKNLGKTVNVSGSPLALRDVILVGTTTGLMLGLNPADGTLVWQYRLQTERVADLQPRQGRGGRGGQGGGFGGGRGGGFGGTAEEPRVYGVSSAPAAVDGAVYVLGDDAALYAFTAQPFDADAPRVVEPSIAVNASDNELLALLLPTDSPRLVPGAGPFLFAAQIDDVGSGVDPNSIVVTLNGEPVEASRIYFGVATGVLTLTLSDAAKQEPALTDGLKTIVIKARDYAGNQVTSTSSFQVDNTIGPPAAPNTNGGRGGFGGGGGGFGGGGRGGGGRGGGGRGGDGGGGDGGGGRG